MTDTSLFWGNPNLHALGELISAVNRPGSYCMSERLTCPMPRVTVAGVGVVPFPVPESVLEALADQAEQAPFGKGTETVLDRTVRDTLQIGPEKLSVGGKAWSDTLAGIVAAATEGLGCPPGSLAADLYKLLLYKRGGFFAPHRDTEKSDGMVATLVVSLPVTGEGGTLIVRHMGHVTRMDMCTDDPSELVVGAFYADCEHEVTPVAAGHRLVLVFNLVRRADIPLTAPDFRAEADRIASWLSEYADSARARPLAPAPAGPLGSCWYSGQDDVDELTATPEKLIWLLEHGYSEAGLSFSALKNLDEAVAGALSVASERADCALYAAILRIEQSGNAIVEWDGYGNEISAEMDEDDIFEDSRWLDSWVAPDGARPEFGQIPVDPDELIPCDHLSGIEPDEEDFEPPTGNAGATVERTYHLGALVLWPRDRAVGVLSRGGVGSVVGHLVRERKRAAGDPGAMDQLLLQAEQLVSVWPEPGPYADRDWWSKAGSSLIRELVDLGASGLLERFLTGSVLPHYDGAMNEALCRAAVALGPDKAGALLCPAFGHVFGPDPNAAIDLAAGLDVATRGDDGADWDDVFRGFARTLLGMLHAPVPREAVGSGAAAETGMLRVQSVTGLFQMLERLKMGRSACVYAELLVGMSGRVDAYRDLPVALESLEQKATRLADARVVLWRHAAAKLIERSGRPPREPRDWIIPAKIPQKSKPGGSDYGSERSWSLSECSRQLQAFCDDATMTTKEFPAREEIRLRLQDLIRRMHLDIDCHTVRKGSPHRLVCVKNRAGYQRRLEQYAEDVASMKQLRGLEAPRKMEPEVMYALEDAIHLGERHAQG